MSADNERLRGWRMLRMVALLGGIALPVLGQSPKPNIVVIWGDDVGVANVSAYSMGLMGIKTPNIDRIGREGVYSPTTTPSKAARRAEPRFSPASPACAPA